MNTLRLGYGPLLLLLYQAAPVNVQQDSLGRYRIAVGYATGQWENEEFGCDGQLLSATPVRHHSAGVQVDVWPDDRVRVSAFGGTASQSVGVTQSADSQYGPGFVEPFAGAYGGVQLAYEGQKLGDRGKRASSGISGLDSNTISAPGIDLELRPAAPTAPPLGSLEKRSPLVRPASPAASG